MNKIFTSLRAITIFCLLNMQAMIGYAANLDVKVDTLGVCIKGNIGVFGDDTLGLFGNVYLDNAKQTGSGIIALTDTQPQLLVSNNSQINNLLIQNPTVVTLEGTIKVVNSLTIKNGVFDTRNSTLLLLPNTTLLVENGILLKNTAISFNAQNKVTFNFQNLILATNNLLLVDYRKALMIPIFKKPKFFKSNYYNSFSPPPETQSRYNS